jgi:hypothetical protein
VQPGPGRSAPDGAGPDPGGGPVVCRPREHGECTGGIEAAIVRVRLTAEERLAEERARDQIARDRDEARRTEQLWLIAEATRMLDDVRNTGDPTEVKIVITMLERHERLAARRPFDQFSREE